MSISALTERLRASQVTPVTCDVTPDVTEIRYVNQSGYTGYTGYAENNREEGICADGLRYATPERMADDRRTCAECRMLTRSGHCIAARRGELPHAARDLMPDIARLHRCVGYQPSVEEADRRSGWERWPGLSRTIERSNAA